MKPVHLDNRWSLKTKTVKPVALYLAGFIVLAIIVVWVIALCYSYLAYDRSSPPAEDRSVPAARNY